MINFIKRLFQKKEKPVHFDYMEEAKKKSVRDRETEDYSLGGAVRDSLGRYR